MRKKTPGTPSTQAEEKGVRIRKRRKTLRENTLALRGRRMCVVLHLVEPCAVKGSSHSGNCWKIPIHLSVSKTISQELDFKKPLSEPPQRCFHDSMLPHCSTHEYTS